MRHTWLVALLCAVYAYAQVLEEGDSDVMEILLPPVTRKARQRMPRFLEFEAPIESWPANGVPGDVNVYPSFEERAMGTWLNVVCTTHTETNT